MIIDGNNVIQKSTLLLDELKKSKLTMQELKCVEVYLSKINSHNPERRKVTFEKDDIKEIFGGVTAQYLKQCLADIRSIQVSDLTEEGDIITDTNINLFDMTELRYSTDEQQILSFTLSCSLPALQYVFNLEDLRYLRYKLRNIVYLKSKYSYQLFLYLVNQKCKYKNHPEFIRNGIFITVDELAEQLNTPYNGYREINRYILKPCIAEINELTSLSVACTAIKADRAVSEILFRVTDWGELETISKETEKTVTSLIKEQPSSDQQESILNSDVQTILDLYPQFSVEDIKAVYNRILKLQPDKGQYGTARIDYFKSVYDDAARQEHKNGKKINDYIAYIIKMLDKRLQAGDEL